MSKQEAWKEHNKKNCINDEGNCADFSWVTCPTHPEDKNSFMAGYDAAKKDNVYCYCGDTKLKLEDHHCEGCTCQKK